MVTNIKYDHLLIDLKKELVDDKAKLDKAQKKLSDYEWKIERRQKGVNCARVCLVLSIILTAFVIIAAVYFFPTILEFCAQEFAGPDSIDSAYVIVLFGSAIIIHIINFILTCISEKEFHVILFLCIIPPAFFIAPFVEIYYIIKHCAFMKRFLNDTKKEYKSQQNNIFDLEKQIKHINQKITETETNISEVAEIYNRALNENNLELMLQAANKGDSKAIKYLENQLEKENKEKASELYKQATAGNTVDKKLLERAADLGNESACFDLGKELYYESISEYYTESEKKIKLKQAEKYLSLFENSPNIEGRFLYVSLFVMSGSTDKDKWKNSLKNLREIKESGKLPENYSEALDIAIKGAVQMVDTLEKTSNNSYSRVNLPTSSYKYDYDPHYSGTFLDSREKVKSILADPYVSEQEKQRVVAEHKRWHLDTYDFGV